MAGRSRTSQRIALVLHPLDAESEELTEIRQNALAAARELPGSNGFRGLSDLTVSRLFVYLYGSRSPVEERMSPSAVDPRLAALSLDRMFLMERRCATSGLADPLATLARLHGEGMLTDDQFETAKARLLS